MKNLFSIKNVATACLAVAMAFSFSSCDSDPCKDIDCVNGTLTESGDNCSCVCEAGYEGADCTNESRVKFVGTYNFTDACTGVGYSQTISNGNSAEKIVFSNLGDFSTAAVVTANVDLNALTIVDATDAAGRRFTGSGQISGNNLSLTYSVTYSDGSTETCAVTGIKQ